LVWGGVEPDVCRGGLVMSKFLPEDSKKKILGINNRVFFAVVMQPGSRSSRYFWPDSGFSLGVHLVGSNPGLYHSIYSIFSGGLLLL